VNIVEALCAPTWPSITFSCAKLCRPGLLTKKAVVEEGLRLLVKVKEQESVRRLRGKIVFDSGTRQLEKGEQLQ